MVGLLRRNNSSLTRQDWKEFQSEKRHMKLPQAARGTSSDMPSFSSRIKKIIKSSIPSCKGNIDDVVGQQRNASRARPNTIHIQPIPNPRNVRHVEWKEFHKRFGTKDAQPYRTL